MTNKKMKEILTNTIIKAMKNGFFFLADQRKISGLDVYCEDSPSVFDGIQIAIHTNLGNMPIKMHFTLSDLLFNHAFMQAACGGWCQADNKKCCKEHCEESDYVSDHNDCLSLMKHHHLHVIKELSQIPTDSDRLKYVKENILGVE
jgi:hypothetical protein